MPRLCLIEDDPIMGESLADRFQLEGFAIDWHRSGESALDALRAHSYDAVISDVRLPGISGEELFAQFSGRPPLLPFLFITAYASVDRAVRMLKQGARDYVTKPFDIGELVDKVRQAVGEPERIVLEEIGSPGPLGVSAQMRALQGAAPRIAQRARTVLITGESGVGKEVLARHLHGLMPAGKSAPFVAVNCGAIPETLLEASFFGHERGAFTGADRTRKGYFEQAHGGTLFLDEIADLPPAVQVKLLRVLQERRVQRIGAEGTVEIDVRVLFATHRDLQADVRSGRFREDLFYRVNVVHLIVPPLRERTADILPLAQQFLAVQAAEQGESPRIMSPDARAALLAHDWPGNVRELKNRIERACVLVEESTLSAAHLFDVESAPGDQEPSVPTLESFVADAEHSYIDAVLRRFDGRVTVAAAALGISRKTLWEKTKRFRARDHEGDG